MSGEGDRHDAEGTTQNYSRQSTESIYQRYLDWHLPDLHYQKDTGTSDSGRRYSWGQLDKSSGYGRGLTNPPVKSDPLRNRHGVCHRNWWSQSAMKAGLIFHTTRNRTVWRWRTQSCRPMQRLVRSRSGQHNIGECILCFSHCVLREEGCHTYFYCPNPTPVRHVVIPPYKRMKTIANK